MVGKPNKTQPSAVSVDDFLAGVTPDSRRADALALVEIMSRLSGEPARMWGPSIVGFGVRHYRYESGREGEILKVGFAPRKPATVLYGVGGPENEPAVAALGKVTTGKGCVYVKNLGDIDLGRLESLIANTLAQ
ncbi:MAG TPA: DUF1801 domain-containing protein [Caulobacteraceae bacterium]